MAYDYELDTTQTFLPASYGIDITATMDGYTPLTRSFVIQVDPAVAQDTIRTLSDLLSNIWRDGQAAHELTAQDVRDTIISLALQTADFSRLPTSTAGLQTGRVYSDQGVLKVFIAVPPVNWSGSAILSASGSISGKPSGPLVTSASLSGAGGLSSSNRVLLVATSQMSIDGALIGDGTLASVGAQGAFSVAFSTAFDVTPGTGKAFSSAFSADFDGPNAGKIIGSASVAGSGGMSANATVPSTRAFSSAFSSAFS